MHFAGTRSKAGTKHIKVNKSFIKLLIMHFAGMGSKAGTMLIKVNKSFIKLLIMHFAGTGSKAGTMLHIAACSNVGVKHNGTR